MILSTDAKFCSPIADLFPANTILDVEITPNRGDLLSHFGLAREIAALTASSFRAPKVFGVEAATQRTKSVRPGFQSRRETQDKATGSLDFARDDTVKIAATRECPF